MSEGLIKSAFFIKLFIQFASSTKWRAESSREFGSVSALMPVLAASAWQAKCFTRITKRTDSRKGERLFCTTKDREVRHGVILEYGIAVKL